MIKGVVFDMDGLMFDTELLGFKAWQYAGEKMGCNLSYGLFQKILGTNLERTNQIIQKEFGEGFDVNELRRIHDEYASNYIEENGVPVKEGLFELLEFLKTNGYKITAASSTEQEKVRHYFEKAGISGYFGDIVCGDMVKRSKPEPDIYLEAVGLLGLFPSECIALEDSPYGILSAFRAGLKPVMIPDMAEPDEKTEKLLYAKLKSLSDVIELLSHKTKGGAY